jgi:hypothetical protein
VSNYTKATDFAAKDALLSGNPGKVIKGTEIDTEFNNIATAVSTKADLASPTFTGTPSAPTAAGGTNSTQLATTAFVNTEITSERTASVTLTNKTLTSPFVNEILHEGTADAFETTLAFTDPTADRTITFPDKTGTVALTSDIGSAATVTTASGTYAMSGSTTVTITLVGHGRTVNDVVYLNFTSGTAVDGNYTVVTTPDADTFTVTHSTSLTTSGNVTVHYSNIGPVALISNDEAVVGTSTTKAMTAAATKSLIDANKLVRETVKASTTGSTVDFTNIPSGVKRITVIFDGVSLTTNENLLVQIGDSDGLETSGYDSTSYNATGGDTSTAGFIIRVKSSSRTVTGTMTLVNITGFTWVATHTCAISGIEPAVGGGTKTLTSAGTLDRLTITRTVSGNFDLGQINIMYE